MRTAAWAMVIGLGAACGPRAPAGVIEPAEAPTVTSSADAEPDADAPMELREVAPGVFAVLQPAHRRFVDSNAALLVSEAGAVVIDGPQQAATATWLYEQVEAMTQGSRRGLVTTHWHLDHALGVTVLRQRFGAAGAEVEHWGHTELAALLETQGSGQLEEHRAALPIWIERGEAIQASGTKPDGAPLSADERDQLERELAEIRAQLEALDGLALAAPTDPIAEPTRLALGTLRFELLPVRAHTDADLIVHVPEARVLITGDVLDELPFGGHGRPVQWLEVLRRLAALEAETIVPGHGPLMSSEAFDRAIALWSAVLEQAEDAIAAGQGADERYAQWSETEGFAALRRSLVTDPASERMFEASMPGSLARAMAELRGEI